MKKFRRLNFILICLFCLNILLSSCKSQTVEITDPTLKSNLELWQKSNICSYKMIIEVSNLNPSGINGPIDIEIRDGEILSAKLSPIYENQKLSQEQIELIKKDYKDSLTVESLFKFIEFAINQRNLLASQERPDAVKLKVSYDSRYGYPKEIVYQRMDVTDVFSSSKIKEFEVINSKNSCH